MNKLLLVLPFCMLMVVACDSSQDSQSSKAEKTVTSVEPAELAIEKDVAPEAEVKTEAVVEVETVKPEVKVAMSGEQIYKRSCQSCHASGAAGAPKLGDTAAWKARVAKGTDVLYLSALKGIPGTAMMAKGTCGTCSEEELNAAVDYMVSKIN
ncbi:MAG: c-type cytochrome [Gammaproteobacteria bacterium]|nr:c-type cytochrome [Gammaproteobacteria bacterium]